MKTTEMEREIKLQTITAHIWMDIAMMRQEFIHSLQGKIFIQKKLNKYLENEREKIIAIHERNHTVVEEEARKDPNHDWICNFNLPLKGGNYY